MSSPIIDVAFYDAKPYDRVYFERAKAQERIHWRFFETRLSLDTVAMAKGAGAVCVFVNDVVQAECIHRLSDLGVKLIALRCAGYNHVDLAAAKHRKLAVTRVPAYSPHAVAEHAVGLLMTLNRKIHRAYNRVREHNFALHGLVGFDVAGKTIGIIGTGKIGKIAAQIFRGFEATVLAHDPFPNPDWAARVDVRYTDLPTLLSKSDIISLHVPLLPETRHLINRDTLACMKPGVFIVNTSRGKLIDTAALIQALKQNRLGGVALDVYEEEEGVFFEDLSEQVLQDDVLSRLLSFPNVLITSHQAFLTHEALTEIARVTTQNIVNLDAKQPFLEGTVL